MQTRLQIYVQEENESVSEVHHYHEMPTLPSSLAVRLPCLHGLPDLGVPPHPTMGPMAAICGSGTSWPWLHPMPVSRRRIHFLPSSAIQPSLTVLLLSTMETT